MFELSRECRVAWIACAVVASMSLGQASAQEPGVGSPVVAIADGQPWTMSTPDGKKLRLTLHDDGTGRIEGGPVPLTPKWRATPDGFCMTPSPLMGERCMVLEPTSAGYVARRQDELTFSLTR